MQMISTDETCQKHNCGRTWKCAMQQAGRTLYLCAEDAAHLIFLRELDRGRGTRADEWSTQCHALKFAPSAN